jgi:DnaJ-class molecular chaperone with C-terminal Zn finger domain
MTDYFALLGQERRPWLDSESLKTKFLELSGEAHPDRVHRLSEAERSVAQQRYVELNAAFNCLRNPKDRLRHLLQLETGAVPQDIKQVPAELIDDFMKVGQLCRETDSLLVEKERSSSPLLKVQLFQRSQDATDRIQLVLQQLKARRESLVEQLRALDAQWVNAKGTSQPDILQSLESIVHLFGFYDRWIAQLQERIARLSF